MSVLGNNVLTVNYDQNGNFTSTTDAEGNEISYVYDTANGRLKSITDDIGLYMSVTYDTSGNVKTTTDNAGTTTTFDYFSNGTCKSKTFCILFPTDFLFEGFIGGFMQSVLSDAAKVRLQASEVALVEDIIIDEQSYGKAFTMRHDILVEHKFILDTKYKEISRIKGNDNAIMSIRAEANQTDLYQMFAYAVKRNVKDIYPMYRIEDEANTI